MKKQNKYLFVLFFVLFGHITHGQLTTKVVYKDTFVLEYFSLSKPPEKLYPKKYITETIVEKKVISKKNIFDLRFKPVSLKDTFSINEGLFENEKTPFAFEAREIKNYQETEIPMLFYKDKAHSNIKYLDKAHGLFSNVILNVNQSPDGKIWLLSEREGLGIYNSRKIIHLTMQSGLPSDNLRTSFLDSKGNMWIATEKGICYIKDNKIYTPRKQIEHRVFSITEDAEGNIWFGTFRNGLFKIENDSLVSINRNYINGIQINALHSDKENNLWIGADSFCIVKYNGKTFKNHILYPNRNEDVCIDIHENEHGLWFSFFDTPLILHKDNQFLECTFEGKPYFRAFNITENSSGLWLADYLSGIYRLDFRDRKIKLFDEDDGISTYAIYGAFADNNNNVWISTLHSGIFRIDRQVFTKNNEDSEIPLKVVRNIAAVDNQVWYIPDGGEFTKQEGSFIYQYTNLPISEEAPLGYFYDAKFTAPDTAWIAAFGQGILYFTPENYTFYIFEKLRYFTQVSSFNDKVFYFATYNNGLVKYEKGEFFLINKTHGLASHGINRIEHDSRGNLWIAYSYDGLGVITDEGIAWADTSAGLSDNRINDIYEDNKNRIWVAGESGLNIIQNNKIGKLDISTGLISNHLRVISQDRAGNIWITSDKGITKLSENEPNTFTVKNYDLSYGLYLNDFMYTIEQLPGGEIVFAKQDGFIRYNPKFERPEKTKPILNIDKIILNSDTLISPVNTGGEIYIIDAGKGIFIESTGILWNNEEQLRHSYSLINKKNDTVLLETDIGNSLRLQGIEPGEYRLNLKIERLNGMSDSLDLHLQFLPHWWQTLEAGLGALVFTLLLIWLTVQITLARQKKHRQRLEEEVMKQTKELVEKNRINEALLAEIHHRVKNNLQKISSLIYLNLDFITHKKQRDILLEIDLRLNTMALIHEMLYSKSDFEKIPIKEYLQELQTSIDSTLNSGRQEIEYVYDIQVGTLNVSNSATIGMFTNEAITNAIKYAFKDTENPEIRLSFVKQGHYYIYSIKDNGCGIDKYKKTKENSFGMKLFDIFARQIDAKLSIISENGIELRLRIPEKSLE